ncbi:MAG TPA: HD domain-containing phosphohydrolase [Bryobacteraceae bacterium]|nr:HD domain-containing phosphohydrolase [Bryobacteraceae bacterium]
MPGVAIGFIALTAIGGALALHQGFLQWHCRNWLQFVVYGLMALLTSVWKVALPGIHGTVPANFIYVLLGIVDLSLGEILVTGCSSVLFQCVWKAKTKHTISQVLFHVTSTASSIYVAHAVFYSSVGGWIGLKEPILLCVAACVYFVTNTGAIAVITGLTEQKNIARIWRRCYFWSFPYYLVGAGCAEGIQIMNRLLGWQSTVVIPPILYFIYRLYSLYLSRLEKEKEHAEIQRKHAEEMASLHLRTIEALALAIEAKDQTTHDHLRRVQVYCLEIAREIGLPGPQRDALLAASLLHDIGKLAVPEHIISKPGRLTAEEFEKMKIHPIVGAEILERVEFPYPVAPIVRGHHEKWDGSGYPDGLNGEDIPIGARILSVVDCLDALASDRQYRRALPLDEAMAIVAAESGKSYEPRIVDILKRNYHDWEAKARDSKPVWFRLSTDIRVEGVASTGDFEKSLPQGKPRPEPRPPVEFFNRIAEARQEAQTLYEVAQDLVNSLSLHDTLSVMAMRLKRLVPHDSIAVFIRRDDEVVCEFANGDDARLFATLRIPLGQGLSGWVVENQTPILNGNPSVELGYLKDQTKFSVMRSTLAVPLQSASGVVGALALYSSQRDAFSKDHLRIMQAVSSKLAQSIENSLRLQRAEGDATTDFLTGLPNARSLFLHLQQVLDKAREIQRSVAILVCDLDGFKVVNDNHGHLTGNRLLQAVAGAILRGCRSGDYAARMGGDEFVIILPQATHAEAIVIADRFRATVEATSRELGVAGVSMSIGISEYPAHGKEPEELLAEADRRMYLDKQARKRNMHATLSRLLEAIDDEATVKT